MRISRTTRAAVAAVAAGALAFTGCSSNTEGEAVAVAADADTIDLDALDTGDYNTEPKDFVAEGTFAGDFGPAVESQRLAEFVVGQHLIDPTLVEGSINTGVAVGGAGHALTGEASDVIEEYGMISGFNSYRSTVDRSRTLGIAVWRFPTDADADQAARALFEYDTSLGGIPDEYGYAPPEAEIVSYPDLPGTYAYGLEWDTLGTSSRESITAQGSFIIYTYADTDDDDQGWLTDTTTRAVQQQKDLLAQFPPTPVEEIPNLPVDLDKVLARTVGFLDDDTPQNAELAVYGPDGWMHFDSDPAGTAELFEDTGTDRVAKSNTTVYRTGSEDGARTVADSFYEGIPNTYPDLVEDAVLSDIVPGARCMTGDIAEGRVSICFMTYGRYVSELHGFQPVSGRGGEYDTLGLLPQRLAAQYVKFVRAEELGLGEN